MKILTTQDLNLRKNQQLSNKFSQTRDFRLKNYSEQVKQSVLLEDTMQCSPYLSFKGASAGNGKKIINSVKKAVGDIKREANPAKKKGDSFLNSPFFNKVLDVVSYETVVTATVAAIACAGRALTILALPTKKNKEDNNYAAGQAGASGIIGFITAFILTAPFKAGSDYVMKNMKKNLSEKTLKRLYPHLDLNSIVKDSKRLAIEEWKDIKGNKFIDDMKECAKLPEFKNLADVSEKTFANILKVDVDWASQKGKSFNDVVLRNGKKLYDEINMSKLGIVVNEEGMGTSQILLKDVDKSYMEALIKDAKETKSTWGDLDINSVYNKDNVVQDFRQWKDTKGNQWKLDLDEIGVTSPYETADYKPRLSGVKRFDTKENVYKFSTYQENGQNGNLGTEITNSMVEADRANDGLFKLLTWGPDLLFRVPVAATTVAIIPWVMKNVFHLQKSNASKTASVNKSDVDKEDVKDVTQNKNNNNVNFKGKDGGGIKNWFVKQFGELYGKPLIENESVHNFSKKLSKLPGSVTEHMSALGSLITSSVYVHQTLTKKDIDPDRRRTLAVNQALCFIVPTIAAYTVNKLINSWVKNKGYRYSGLNQSKIDIAKAENKELAGISQKQLGKRLKGIRTLAAITVFTLIYRYATPVIITPIANWIGDKWNASLAENKKAAKRESETKKAA